MTIYEDTLGYIAKFKLARKRCPTEDEIAARFGVTRETARRRLRILEERGRIEVRKRALEIEIVDWGEVR